MDARQLALAYDTIKTALKELDDLHLHRMGRHSAEDMHEELQAIRSGLAIGNGLLLPQMRAWFDIESMRKELGNLQTIMMIVEKSLDKEVRSEIASEGYSASKTFVPVERALHSIAGFRSALDQHEKLMKGAQQGARLSVQELASLEDTLLRFTELEERVIAYGETAVKRIEPVRKTFSKQPRKGLSRIAAGFILPIAAAAATMFGGGPVYGQDVINAPTAIVQAEKSDEISDASIENLLKLGTVEEVLNETSVISGAKIEYVKYNPVTRSSNFYGILNNVKEDGAIIVLYENETGSEPSKRNAILAKLAGAKFNLPIVAYNASLASTKDDFFKAGHAGSSTSIPSLLLATKKDPVKEGENNQIKIVDTIRGGPDANTTIAKWYKNIMKYWVPSNITAPNGKFVWRSLNSENAQWTKVPYAK